MNFSKFDVSILVTMSLAVVIMSFAFPALELTDQSDQVSENDIPEFNMSASMFDFTGEFPRQPNAADSGTITYSQERFDTKGTVRGLDFVYVDRPVESGAAVQIQNTTLQTPYTAFVFQDNIQNAGNKNFRQTFTEDDVGEKQVFQPYSNGNWTITYTITEINNYNQSNMTIEADYQVQNAPDDTKGISAIPVIGGVTDQVAQFVGWLVTVFFWASLFLVELVINVLGIAFGIISYTFGMASWLITTYAAIISAAPGWAGVVLVIPSVLLFAEFAKLAVIGIKMLPTT